jgi:hypothetical protein
MIKETVVAIVVSALACGAWASSASAKSHPKHQAPATSTAAPIPGVNPMTNATATPPVSQPAPYAPIPGVNPMTNAAAIPPVAQPAPYASSPGLIR